MNAVIKPGFEISSIKGGPEHEYWKHKIAEKFKEQGYEVELEKRIDGHSVDLVVTKNGKTVAIEIETGKSDAEANIRKDFEAGFEQVVCVVVSTKLASSLSRIFAEQIEHDRLKLLARDEVERY